MTILLGSLSQDLRKHGRIRHAETLLRLRNDLIYLQRRYRIEKVDLARSENPPS
jgi:hypothetical protein